MKAVASAEALADNTSMQAEWQGENVLIARSGGELFAIANRCTHQDSPLHGGRVRRGYIACPLHGVMFDLRTGAPQGQLTREAVTVYEVCERDGQILLGGPRPAAS